MSNVATEFPSVVRTERGLTVGGRRLTLYLLEDHFKAGYPPQLVQDIFRLSDKEIVDVVGYIQAHRDEFEAEYQSVLKKADENRRYWEERNRERMEQIKNTPPTPEVAAKRARLEELRRRRA
jgi:polyhydroxyalkanoate synthesis regulator phasin